MLLLLLLMLQGTRLGACRRGCQLRGGRNLGLPNLLESETKMLGSLHQEPMRQLPKSGMQRRLGSLCIARHT